MRVPAALVLAIRTRLARRGRRSDFVHELRKLEAVVADARIIRHVKRTSRWSSRSKIENAVRKLLQRIDLGINLTRLFSRATPQFGWGMFTSNIVHTTSRHELGQTHEDHQSTRTFYMIPVLEKIPNSNFALQEACAGNDHVEDQSELPSTPTPGTKVTFSVVMPEAKHDPSACLAAKGSGLSGLAHGFSRDGLQALVAGCCSKIVAASVTVLRGTEVRFSVGGWCGAP